MRLYDFMDFMDFTVYGRLSIKSILNRNIFVGEKVHKVIKSKKNMKQDIRLKCIRRVIKYD